MVIEGLHWLGFDAIFTPGNRLYWPYLFSAGLIAMVYQRCYKLPGNLFCKTIWWHPSAQQDYLIFMLLSLLKLSAISILLPEVKDIIWWCLQLWQSCFGYNQKQTVGFMVTLSFTLSLFIANDCSRYWLHRCMHQQAWLWRIHRLHHTAKVLTPFTFFRIHPLESLLFGLRYVLITGVVTSLYVHWFGFGLQIQQWLGSHLIVALANLTGSNLRHWHVPITYPQWLQSWLICPAQHQWHHTIEGYKYNFGSILAIWDKLFGSLYKNHYHDHFTFGINSIITTESLVRQLLLPFVPGIKQPRNTDHFYYEKSTHHRL